MGLYFFRQMNLFPLLDLSPGLSFLIPKHEGFFSMWQHISEMFFTLSCLNENKITMCHNCKKGAMFKQTKWTYLHFMIYWSSNWLQKIGRCKCPLKHIQGFKKWFETHSSRNCTSVNASGGLSHICKFYIFFLKCKWSSFDKSDTKTNLRKCIKWQV